MDDNESNGMLYYLSRCKMTVRSDDFVRKCVTVNDAFNVLF